jgi:hypothetical protein
MNFLHKILMRFIDLGWYGCIRNLVRVDRSCGDRYRLRDKDTRGLCLRANDIACSKCRESERRENVLPHGAN